MRHKVKEALVRTRSIRDHDRVFVLTGAGISARRWPCNLSRLRRPVGRRARGRRGVPARWSATPNVSGVFIRLRRKAAARERRTKSRNLGAGGVGAQAGRALLPVHAERGQPARTRGLPESCAHAWRTLRVLLREAAPAKPLRRRAPVRDPKRSTFSARWSPDPPEYRAVLARGHFTWSEFLRSCIAVM